MGGEWGHAAQEAYRLYVRLRWLARDLPRDHPVRPAVVAAALAAWRHWRALLARAAPGPGAGA